MAELLSRFSAGQIQDWANAGLVISLAVGAIATFIVVWTGNIKEATLKREVSTANAVAEKAKLDSANANEKAAALNKRALEIEASNLSLKLNLEKAIKEANTEKQKLTEMQIEVADARRKQAEAEKSLELLKVDAKKAARGITSSYDFNGAKRESVSGRMSLSVGDEISAFQKMMDLEKNRKYTELIAICQNQIKKTPGWLTPYFFLGLAQLNMGQRDDAISNFQHVTRNAPGDPNYQQAEDLLNQLMGR